MYKYEDFKMIRMTEELFEFNGCSECMMCEDCHNHASKRTIYCPEIDEDRYKKPYLFKDDKELNNKILDMNGYIPPKDYEYEED